MMEGWQMNSKIRGILIGIVLLFVGCGKHSFNDNSVEQNQTQDIKKETILGKENFVAMEQNSTKESPKIIENNASLQEKSLNNPTLPLEINNTQTHQDNNITPINKPIDDTNATQILEENTTHEQPIATAPQPKNLQGFGAVASPKELLESVDIIKAPSQSTLLLPLGIDLSPLMPPIGNQGTQNSCVGWAVGYYLKSYQERIEHNTTYGEDANYSNRYSPAFVYNITKVGECEEGANLYDALRLLKEQGVALWEDMPYYQDRCDDAPSAKAMIKSKCGKISDFKRLDTHSRDFILTMRYVLSQTYPIVVAINPYDDFINPKLHNEEYFYQEFNTTQIAPIMSHSVVVVGYDDTREAFKIVNSWGKNWGNEGYLWIDYEVFQKIVIEAFVVEDDKGECNFTQHELEIISQDIASKEEPKPLVEKKPVELTITDNAIEPIGVTLINREWVANSVTFSFTFSRSVSEFSIDDIGVTNGIKSNFRGSGDTYYLDVTPSLHSTNNIIVSVNQNSAFDSDGNGNAVGIATQEVNTVKAFITTWDTTKSGSTHSNQIRLGSSDSGYVFDYTIDWGDGSIWEGATQDSEAIHTYAQEGIYTIKITGRYPAVALLDNYYVDTDNLKLLSIEQWGTQPWRAMNGAFYNVQNLQDNSIDNPNLHNVNSMYGIFWGASLLDVDISSWNVSNVTDMREMFTQSNLSTQNYDKLLE